MTEKSSPETDYFTKFFQIWEDAVSQTTLNTIKNEILDSSHKLKKDKINEFNQYMKDIMSKNISEHPSGIAKDIQTLNKSIENVQQQLDILTKKLDKLTNPRDDKSK